jgi:ribosomal protein L11 methylase PrmA
MQLGVDIEDAAVEASGHNAELNGVSRNCSFVCCARLPSSPGVAAPEKVLGGTQSSFDVCVANIFSQDLIVLRDSICTSVRVGGHIVMSGLLCHQVRNNSS